MLQRFSLFGKINSFKSKSLRALVVFLLLFGMFASNGSGSNVPTAQAADSTNQIIVQLLPGRDILGLNQLLNITLVRALSLNNTYLLSLPLGSSVSTILTLLRLSPLVVFAEPNYKLYSTEAQQAFIYYDNNSDPLADGQPNPEAVQKAKTQWAWQRIDLDPSQDLSEGQNVTVATLDTGVNANHPAVKNQLVAGYNALDGSANVNDDNGHGSHVAGTIAARHNAIGVVGVAPDANLYAFTFIGGPAYDTTGDGRVTSSGVSADRTKVRTTTGARATAPFIVDQHLVFSTGSKVEMFGDPQDFNNGVGQAGVRILSWREVR